MGWLVGLLVIAVLGIGALAAWLYVEKQKSEQTRRRPFGSGAAGILSGILTAYTGGAFGAVRGAGQRSGAAQT